MLINSFMEALLKLPSTTCDIKKLRYFYDVTEGHIRNLNVLDVSENAYGCLLLPVMMKKTT